MKAIDIISFNYADISFSFKSRNKLKEFLLFLFKNEKKQLEELNYTFCTDAYLLPINQNYLNHNTLTDIITFELSNPGHPIIGDIYISAERVKENASLFNTSFIKELHRVIFHGALHLSGYKDKTKEDEALMRQKEDFYLNKYFCST